MNMLGGLQDSQSIDSILNMYKTIGCRKIMSQLYVNISLAELLINIVYTREVAVIDIAETPSGPLIFETN